MLSPDFRSEPRERYWVFEGTESAPRCHAATIVEAAPGELLAAWFAGTSEGATDSATWMARFEGGRWSPPWVFAKVAGHAHGNPRLFHLPAGGVGIVYAVNYGAWCRGGSRNFIRVSRDAGRSWTCPQAIDTPTPFLGKNKALPLDQPAELLLPVTLEGRPYGASALIADGGGRRWQMAPSLFGPEGVEILQPALAPLADGSILTYLRTNAGFIWQSRSADRGRTWSEPEPTDLPNNHSGVDLVRAPDGALLLACNPVSDRSKRTPLVVMRSTDEGRSWNEVAALEGGEGEFSYPALIVAADGRVHVAYTYRRTAIRHAVL